MSSVLVHSAIRGLIPMRPATFGATINESFGGFPWAVFLTAFWEVERLQGDADEYGPRVRQGSDEPASHRA